MMSHRSRRLARVACTKNRPLLNSVACAHIYPICSLVLRVPVADSLDLLSVLGDVFVHNRAANAEHTVDLTRQEPRRRLREIERVVDSANGADNRPQEGRVSNERGPLADVVDSVNEMCIHRAHRLVSAGCILSQLASTMDCGIWSAFQPRAVRRSDDEPAFVPRPRQSLRIRTKSFRGDRSGGVADFQLTTRA